MNKFYKKIECTIFCADAKKYFDKRKICETLSDWRDTGVRGEKQDMLFLEDISNTKQNICIWQKFVTQFPKSIVLFDK